MNDTSRSLAQQAPPFFCKPELPTRWIFHVGSNILEPNRDLYHLSLSLCSAVKCKTQERYLRQQYFLETNARNILNIMHSSRLKA
jgi:hypothetical protein